MIGIYKITSPTGKIYIGQSINIKRRLARYKSLQCHAQTKLYHSLKKYGFKSHKVEILRECEKTKLNELEIYYIDLFKTCTSFLGLNLRGGGANGKHSLETKRKQSKIKKLFFKKNRSAYNKLVSQLMLIERDGKNNPNYGKGKRVVQFSRDGRYIRKYLSVVEAEKINSFNNALIYGCCNRKQGHHSHKNYIWRFANDCVIINGRLKENILFRKIQANKQSKFKGVCLNKHGKWTAGFYDTKIKKKVHLGVYATEEDAGRSHNVYLKSKYGISTPLNNVANPFSVSIIPNKILLTRGVKWNGRHQFESRIRFKGKGIYIGGFYTQKEAVLAYNKKALELLGDKAKLNLVA